MNSEIVQNRLNRNIRTRMVLHTVTLVVCFLGGLLILYGSFWVTYGILWYLSHSLVPLANHTLLLLAGAFMTLVVVVGARQNWEELELVQREVRIARDLDVTLTPYSRHGLSYRTDVMKAGVFEVRSIASVVNFILCGGVKLVFGSGRTLRELRRLKNIDKGECARVIQLLHMMPGRQPFEEIVKRLPGLNPVKTFDDLRYVEGVLFLANEPSGLTLLPEFRAELDRNAASLNGSGVRGRSSRSPG